jgi:prevent-host-death family protein
MRGRWRLQDAKARFSEVVRQARSEGPQRVTLHGQDAVVIVDAAAYDQARATRTGQQLVDALAASPLGEVAFDRESIDSPVRPVEL